MVDDANPGEDQAQIPNENRSLEDRVKTMQDLFLNFKKDFLQQRFKGLLATKVTEQEKALIAEMPPQAFDRALTYLTRFNTNDLASVYKIMEEMVTKPGEMALRGSIEDHIAELRDAGLRFSEIPEALRLAKQYARGNLPVIRRRVEWGCTLPEVQALLDFSLSTAGEYGLEPVEDNDQPLPTPSPVPYPTERQKTMQPFIDAAKAASRAGNHAAASEIKIKAQIETIGQTPTRPQGPAMANSHKSLIQLHRVIGDPITVGGITYSVDCIVEAFRNSGNARWMDKPLYAKIWMATQLAKRNGITSLEHLCDYISKGNVLGDFDYTAE